MVTAEFNGIQSMQTAKFHGCQMHISKIRVCHGIPGTHAYATSVSTCVSKVGISYFKPITKDIYEGSLPKIYNQDLHFIALNLVVLKE